MNRADDHVAFEELAAGHALSALEPEDEQHFAQHLAACTRCQRDVAEHEATLAMLAYAADPVELPPSVLEGIRAGLPAARVPSKLERAPAASAPTSASGSAPVVLLADARERRERRTARAGRWLALAAAAALVLSLGAWNLALRAGQQDAQQYGDRLALAVRELSSPGSRTVPLTREDGTVAAVAVVRGEQISLVLQGLAPNARETAYVLWAQDAAGAVRPVGAFDVQEAQVDVVTDLPVDAGTDEVTAFHLSHEHGDVAPPQPAGEVLASGKA